MTTPDERERAEFEDYERAHGRGDMLQPHPDWGDTEGFNNEGTQSRWILWKAARREERKRTLEEIEELFQSYSKAGMVGIAKFPRKLRALLSVLDSEEK